MPCRALSSNCMVSGLPASNHTGGAVSRRGEQIGSWRDPERDQLSPAAQCDHALVCQGSLVFCCCLLPKPEHLSAEGGQVKIKPPLPFPRAPVAMQFPWTLGPENTGRWWSVYHHYSIAWHAGKQRHCTVGISDLSFSWQPLSYKAVSEPSATVAYPQLHGRAFKHSSALHHYSAAQQTLFTACLALQSPNSSSKAL